MGKAAAFFIGVGFLAAQTLHWIGYIDVNWAKVRRHTGGDDMSVCLAGWLAWDRKESLRRHRAAAGRCTGSPRARMTMGVRTEVLTHTHTHTPRTRTSTRIIGIAARAPPPDPAGPRRGRQAHGAGPSVLLGQGQGVPHLPAPLHRRVRHGIRRRVHQRVTFWCGVWAPLDLLGPRGLDVGSNRIERFPHSPGVVRTSKPTCE